MGRIYSYVWFPSNLPDRVVNLVFLAVVLLLFVVGFDYAKVPTVDFVAARASPVVQMVGAVALALIGLGTTWGLAREEYVTNARSVTPTVFAYAVLATLFSLAWLVRGAMSAATPYLLDPAAAISWPTVREVVIGGQLLLVLNLATLYYKKGDGAAVRAFANSFDHAQRRLRRLLDPAAKPRDRDGQLAPLQIELKALAAKQDGLSGSLHEAEAAHATAISTAADTISRALDGALDSRIAADPVGVLEPAAASLAVFAIKLDRRG